MSLKGDSHTQPGVTSLPALFELSVLTHPDARALTDAATGKTYTFRELNQTTNQLAR